MKLYMKQHIFTWGDKFTIYDEAGNDCFYVQGEVFSWGKKLHVYDRNEQELAFIQQKVFSFLPKYYITIGGRSEIEVVKEFTFFRQVYSVNGLGWTVNGDFFAHDYQVSSNSGSPVAIVTKQWFTLGDAYEINIFPEVDPVTALSVVLVIDACIASSNNN